MKFSRSLTKAITWRIIAFTITTILTYFLTRQVKLSLTLGGLEAFFKIGAYIIHDKMWEKK